MAPSHNATPTGVEPFQDFVLDLVRFVTTGLHPGLLLLNPIQGSLIIAILLFPGFARGYSH
jgi:hypothetical protein